MATLSCCEDVLAVADGNNNFILDFHLKFYPSFQKSGKNVFYDGISASSMMMMMWESIPENKSDTRAKLLKFLSVNSSKEKLVTSGYSDVLRSYQKMDYGNNDAFLRIVHKMYTSPSLGPLKADFLAKVHGDYCCSHAIQSFEDPIAAAERINADFSKDTNDLVDDIVSEEQLVTAPIPKIVLVSSMYFRGVWEVPFDPTETKRKEFTRSNQRKVFVQMMEKKRATGMSYTNLRNLQSHACAMYFEGGRFCMIVVRPSSRYAFQLDRNMKEHLLPAHLIANFKRYHRKSRRGEGGLLVSIQMPRFHITSKHMINKPLTEMPNFVWKKGGKLPSFPDAFENGEKDDASVSHVIQRCEITINETGTTQIEERPPLLPPRPSWYSKPKCVKINLDRTFYFLLFDYTNNFIIAAGVVDDPNNS